MVGDGFYLLIFKSESSNKKKIQTLNSNLVEVGFSLSSLGRVRLGLHGTSYVIMPNCDERRNIWKNRVGKICGACCWNYSLILWMMCCVVLFCYWLSLLCDVMCLDWAIRCMIFLDCFFHHCLYCLSGFGTQVSFFRIIIVKDERLEGLY